MTLARTCRAAVAAAVALTVSVPAFAQQAGVKAGVNVSSVKDSDDFEGDSSRVGPIGGVWLRTAPAGRFSFQVEGLFSEKGFEMDLEVLGILAKADMRIRYVEVPLLGRVDFGGAGSGARVFALAGMAPAFKLAAHLTSDVHGEQQRDDVGDDVKAFDLGLAGAVGIEWRRVQVEARYTHGLTSIPTDPDSDQTIRNRVFSVLAGFRLR